MATNEAQQASKNGGRLATESGALAIGRRTASQWTWVAALLVVALAVATLGYVAYRLAFQASVPPPATVVERGSIVSIVSATGEVVAARVARLDFPSRGQVKEVLKEVGQAVQAGEVLATLEDGYLQLEVDQARSDLRVAQLRLEEASEIATPEEVAAAKAMLAAAQARVGEIRSGSQASAIVAAEAEVRSAEAKLAAARARTAQLTSESTPAAVAGADQAVAEAEAALQQAEAELSRLRAEPSAATVTAAGLGVDRARQSLLASQVSRDADCGRDSDSSDCKSANAEVWAAELEVRRAEVELQQAQAGPRPEAIAAAEAEVESARKGLASARADSQELAAGVTAADLQAARSAEETARAELLSAQSRLEEVRSGAKTSDLEAAQATVATAAATLARTAPRASTLALAEEEVRQAEIRLHRADLDLSGAALKAPFGGVVTEVSINAGEQALGVSAEPAFTLVAPQAMRVEATVDAADVLKIAPGQEVQVTLESVADRTFTGKVARVSALGAVQRGATTYLVTVDLDPGDTRPAPGIAANLDIVTERLDGVLVLPSWLIRSQGEKHVVDVLVDGVPEPRSIQIGASNGRLTEIKEGLAEGDRVLAWR